MSNAFPKISVITPSYNQGEYLEQTILSVINQNYPNLEYIIIDGGSTDNSLEIIKKYENKFVYWVSEPDAGMYHALQKGFEKSSGEIMCWLNSDDMLHPKSLFSMAEILSLDGIQWIQGIPNNFDEAGRTVIVENTGQWSWLRSMYDQECIQQESTAWRRELWEKAGGRVSTEYKLAGDFELWNRFFQYEKLYTPPCLLGGFRIRKAGQLSHDADRYLKEVLQIRSTNSDKDLTRTLMKLKKLQWVKKKIRQSRILNWSFISNRIEKAINELHEFPKQIGFDRNSQFFFVKK